MFTSPPTDDPLYHLRRACTLRLPGAARAAWTVYEGLCWLKYIERFPIPHLAQRGLTPDEQFAIFRAKEVLSR